MKGANTNSEKDQDGREYLDFIAAFSAANYGHCHPLITKRVMAQAQKGASAISHSISIYLRGDD